MALEMQEEQYLAFYKDRRIVCLAILRHTKNMQFVY